MNKLLLYRVIYKFFHFRLPTFWCVCVRVCVCACVCACKVSTEDIDLNTHLLTFTVCATPMSHNFLKGTTLILP